MLLISMVLAIVLVTPAMPAAQNPGQNTPPAQTSADIVVAKVDGQPITDKLVLNAIDQMVEGQQLTPDQLRNKETSFFAAALNAVIENLLLRNEAKARNIAPSQFSIDREFIYFKAKFPDTNSYRRQLAAEGLDESGLLKRIENELTLDQLLRESLQYSAATDADAQKFYDANPQFFEEKPAQIHLAHIFLKVGSSATPQKRAETKKRLEDLRADIENGKMTFENAAAKISEDKENAMNGGEWGTFKAGELLTEIERVAYETKPGAVSPVVETEFGFQLLKVFEVTPPVKTPLDMVRENVKNSLDQTAKQNAYDKFIASLKAKAKIEFIISAAEWNKRFGK